VDAKTRQQLEANIWKVKVNYFLMNFYVYSPILYISFQEKGISLAGIGIIMMVAGIANLLFEIPTGMLADRWGRKHMIMLSAIAGIASMLLWTTSIYLALIVGMACRSLLNNAINGSDTALLYDTLAELKREKEYTKQNGERFSAGMAAFAIASLLASLLSTAGTYRLHFIVTSAVFAIALVVATTIYEPRHHKKKDSLLLHLRAALHHTRKHRELYKIVLYSVSLGATLMIAVTYIQFFLKSVHIDPQYYGFIYAGLGIISTIISFRAHAIEERLGERNTLLFLPAMVLAGIALMAIGNLWTIFAGLVLMEVILGLHGAVLNGYLQRHSTAAHRSTIESLKSFYQSCYQIVLYPIVGFLADTLSIGAAMVFVICIMAFIITPPLYFLVKEAKVKNAPA
jgi:MFS family permease